MTLGIGLKSKDGSICLLCDSGVTESTEEKNMFDNWIQPSTIGETPIYGENDAVYEYASKIRKLNSSTIATFAGNFDRCVELLKMLSMNLERFDFNQSLQIVVDEDQQYFYNCQERLPSDAVELLIANHDGDVNRLWKYQSKTGQVVECDGFVTVGSVAEYSGFLSAFSSEQLDHALINGNQDQLNHLVLSLQLTIYKNRNKFNQLGIMGYVTGALLDSDHRIIWPSNFLVDIRRRRDGIEKFSVYYGQYASLVYQVIYSSFSKACRFVVLTLNDFNERILCDVSLFEMLMRQANMSRPDNLVLYLCKKDTAFILKPTPGHQIEFTQFRQLRTDYYHTNIFSALSPALERVLTELGNNHGYMTAVTDYMMADPSPVSDDFITNVTSDFSRVSQSADKRFDFPYEMFRKDTEIKDELRTMIDVIVDKIKKKSSFFAQELVLIDGQFLSNEIRKYMKLLNK